MQGALIAIIVILCLVFVGSLFPIITVVDSGYRKGPKMSPLVAILYFVSLGGLIVGVSLYADGSDVLTQYTIESCKNDDTALVDLKFTDTCKTIGCTGNCMSPFPIGGVNCVRNILSQKDDSCNAYCFEYIKKYIAIKQYVLRDMNDRDKSIIVSVQSRPIYDKVEDAQKAVFPNIIGNIGYLDTKNDFTVIDKIVWENPSSYTEEKEAGIVFIYVFGALTLLCVSDILYWFHKNQDKLSYDSY